MNGIQSLDRGLDILRLVAQNGQITASFAAEKLGIHQSSASRLLQSLQKAGLVRKPGFHSFAPDFGLLAFAGTALNGFPEVRVCVEACAKLAKESECSACAATLFQGRLIYLASIGDEAHPAMRLVDDSKFPIYKSSLGVALACRLGEEEMRRLFVEAMVRDGVAEDKAKAEAGRLYRKAEKELKAQGCVDLAEAGGNAFNYAADFEAGAGRLAYALFSQEGRMTAAEARKSLAKSIEWSISALAMKRV